MHPRRTALLSFVLDAVLVVAFAATGRASHDEAVLPGLLVTAWPFLVGLVAGWAVTLAWRAPMRPLRTGLGVWAVTVAGGMLLRAVSGQGVVLAFVVVAAVVLLIALIGWRGIAALIRSLRRRRATTA
ncbi:DUF3054 domain-containing protein [Microbacterium sp.]|uniref:DUF3054 domain-containing protein n=1 Tax=Microbacterium sp. TaxID=51671 RepID=UPI00092B6DD4|nr:DUF3054 domain-containing protein [Microbacterium sp.]MBN9184696.1 DUF3054 domain-containing protein [Microbacterium sp.]MBN9187323.1 DUF3054 domain-containing protein [Microbacterium sp.]MBN9193488.1 DUF3054 domain-containing protein [Microbacterium sp.]OJU72440.1 MAG: hypothetical protein BGO04_08650 [Microbacterium sp. 70-38]